MGLSIAVFVPEGIVIASDELFEFKNSDDGFLQKQGRTLFVYQKRFLVCIRCNTLVNDLPWGFYVNKIFFELKTQNIVSTIEFANAFKEKLSKIDKDQSVTCYIAGIDHTEKEIFKYNVLLVDKNKVSPINKNISGEDVYNYHSIGRSMWINKLLLPTSVKQNDIDTAFENVDIDFSKYSVAEAKEFALSLINTSREMDKFCQLKQMVGEHIAVGIVQPLADVEIVEIG